MNAEELLAYVTNAAILFIFGMVLVECARSPRPLTVDAALFFGAMTGLVLSSTLLRVGLIEPSVLQGNISAAILLLLPYLQLRMVRDFSSVRPSILLAAAAVGIASALSLFFVPRPFNSAYLIAIIVGFVVVQGYCTVRLVGSVRGTVGVVRGRTEALAIASAMLMIVMVVAGLMAFFPAQRGLWRAILSIAGLTLGTGYFIGFTPPRWVRTLWQGPAIREFLSTAARLPPDATIHELARELEVAVARGVGSERARIALWDEEQRGFVVPRDGLPPLSHAQRQTLLGFRAFAEQRVMVVDDAAAEDPANAAYYVAAGVRSMLLSPITIGDQRFGVLAASTSRTATFVRDDLDLVALLAGEVAGLIQRRQLTQAAAHVRAQEEATRLKDEFLSAAAHDLRTPLTVILAQSQLLARRLHRTRTAGDEDLAGIDRLVVEAQRMRRLTDDVLDAARAEATGFVADLVPTDLVAIAENVAASVTSNRHHVVVAGDPIEALADGDRIRQVMQNLVDNAVKFSPSGGRILICCREEGDFATFTVEDEGIGIPAWDLPHLFQRFYRGGRTGERGFSGMGIGLFLSKRIVEEHGGSISADSVYGEGARFQVTLPLARATQGRANASAHSGS